MLINNGNEKQTAYLDSCCKHAISEIACFSLIEMKELLDMSKKSYADLLSKISVFTKIAQLAMSSYATLNVSTLSTMIENEKLSLIQNSFSDSNLLLAKKLIGSLTETLTESQDEILSLYNLNPNSLSLYKYDDIVGDINFKQQELTSSLLFKYYEGKKVLKNTSIVMQLFSNARDSASYNIKDLSTLSGDKANNILSYFVNVITLLKSDLEAVESIIDATLLAIETYHGLSLSRQDYRTSFLSRNYDTIKAEMINNYF